ncbi:MAG: flavodoxin family protein [Candidatus Cryosericum sp.]
MDTLIVYYSRTGSTRTVAAALAHELEGTLRELVDADPRTNMLAAVLAALFHRSARLVDPDYDVRPYETVVLITPVWAGNPTPAMNAFVRGVDLTGKKVLIVALGESGENLATSSRLEKMVRDRGGQVIGVHHIHGLSATGRAGPSATAEELQHAGERLADLLREPHSEEG